MKIVCFLIVVYFNSVVSDNTSVVVNAQLLRCRFQPSVRNWDTYINYEISNKVLKGSKCSTYLKGPVVVNVCRKKLYISLNFNENKGIDGDDEFVIVDVVTDPISNYVTELLFPIVIKIYREKPVVVYRLKFEKMVNGEVNEEQVPVKEEYLTCDTSVCNSYGQSQMNQGFCCPCDRPKSGVSGKGLNMRELPIMAQDESMRNPQLVKLFPHKSNNVKINPSTSNEKDAGIHTTGKHGFQDFPVENDFQTILNLAKYDPYLYKENELFNIEKGTKRRSIFPISNEPRRKLVRTSELLPTSQEIRDLNGDTLRMRVNKERLEKVKSQRQTRKINTGLSRKSCGNLSSYSNVRCLRSSNLWYSLYQLEKPEVVQEVLIRVFQKRTGYDGNNYWVDLTRGKTVRLGPYYSPAQDSIPTMAFTYTCINQRESNPGVFPIDEKSVVMLIPSHVEKSGTFDEHPEAKGGIGEYLVVPKQDVSFDGSTCDKIGTSAEGFVEQSDRCERPSGSCLRQQPIDLWIKEMELKVQEKPGIYFLENYGAAPQVQLASLNDLEENIVALEYKGQYEFSVEIEIRSDLNGLIRRGRNAQIQSIVTDTSTSWLSTVEILVVNSGLIGGHFYPQVSDCNPNLTPEAISHGPVTTIPPLQRHIFRLKLAGSQFGTTMSCTVEIFNEMKELIASRQMLLQKGERCLCAFHCSCVCLGDEKMELLCTPLMKEEYEGAGYIGDMPGLPQIFTDMSISINCWELTLMILIFLLSFGTLKMIIGFSNEKVRQCGLDNPLMPKFIIKRGLCSQRVTDCLLNVFFFVIYPTKLLFSWSKYVLLCRWCNFKSKDKLTPSDPKEDGYHVINSYLIGEDDDDDDDESDVRYVSNVMDQKLR